MKKRKIVTSLIMALAMGACSVMGNASVSCGMEQTKEQSYVSNVSGDAVKIAAIHNPIINEEAETVTYSYVYFGRYPQSEVSGAALTENIVNADYVSGEAIVGKEQYCKVTTEEGKNHYFKYEPIKWRVINVEDNKAVLRTDKILDYQPYNIGYQTDYTERGRWNGTSLQYLLNGYGAYGNGFLQRAFTLGEIDGIEDTQIEDQIENHNQFITDKVFLLTLLDSYAMPDKTYLWKTQKSDYANLYSPNKEEQYGAWWLRNDYLIQYVGYVDYVDEKGEFHTRFIGDYRDEVIDDENFQAPAKSTEIGVCPAITLDLTKTNLWKTEEEIKQEIIETAAPIETKKPDASLKPVETEEVTKQPDVTDKPVEEVKTSKEPVSVFEIGDVDKNGQVDLADAQLTLKVALKIEQLPEKQIVYADMDEDGILTLKDAQMVLRKALKIKD